MKSRIALTGILICSILLSCSSYRKVIENGKAKEISLEQALTRLSENEERINSVYVKRYNGTLKINDESIEFKGYIKAIKDSVFLMTFNSKSGFEGVRLLIEKDSVKMINRLEKYYLAIPYSEIAETELHIININFLFRILTCTWSGSEYDYKSIHIAYKGERKRNVISAVLEKAVMKYLINIVLNSDNTGISEFNMMDEGKGFAIKALYQFKENSIWKEGIECVLIRNANKIDITLDINEMVENELVTINFVAPERFKRIIDPKGIINF